MVLNPPDSTAFTRQPPAMPEQRSPSVTAWSNEEHGERFGGTRLLSAKAERSGRFAGAPALDEELVVAGRVAIVLLLTDAEHQGAGGGVISWSLGREGRMRRVSLRPAAPYLSVGFLSRLLQQRLRAALRLDRYLRPGEQKK